MVITGSLKYTKYYQKQGHIDSYSYLNEFLSRGPWVLEDGSDAPVLLLIEDTDNHFAVTVPDHQTEGSLLKEHQGGGIAFTVWTRGGKQLQLPAYYREVESLPCYQSWAVH